MNKGVYLILFALRKNYKQCNLDSVSGLIFMEIQLISVIFRIIVLSIYKIKDLIASNGPLISRGINKRRLERDKTE